MVVVGDVITMSVQAFSSSGKRYENHYLQLKEKCDQDLHLPSFYIFETTEHNKGQ